MGSSSNKPATTTITQTRTPWGQTSGQLSDMTNRVSALANDNDYWTPAVSGATARGIGQLEELGQQPGQGNQYLTSILPGSAQGFDQGLGQLSKVAGGDYLNSNPYLAAAMKPALDDVQNRVNSQFTAAGRYGSGNHASELTRRLAETEAQVLQNNYATERASQDNAARSLFGGGFQGAGFTGQLDQSAAVPAMYSIQAGQMQDTLANQTKQAPINAVNWQNSIISPISQAYGTTTGTQQTVQPVNRFTQALGLGQMGLGLLSAPMTGGGSLFGTQAAPSLLGSMTNYWG